jgi:hypothetical protein
LFNDPYLYFPLAAQAQRKQPASVQLLTQLEEGMRNYANDIVNATEMVDRFRADSFFTRALVQALRVPYSFSYRFDSLKTISTCYMRPTAVSGSLPGR